MENLEGEMNDPLRFPSDDHPSLAGLGHSGRIPLFSSIPPSLPAWAPTSHDPHDNHPEGACGVEQGGRHDEREEEAEEEEEKIGKEGDSGHQAEEGGAAFCLGGRRKVG